MAKITILKALEKIQPVRLDVFPGIIYDDRIRDCRLVERMCALDSLVRRSIPSFPFSNVSTACLKEFHSCMLRDRSVFKSQRLSNYMLCGENKKIAIWMERFNRIALMSQSVENSIKANWRFDQLEALGFQNTVTNNSIKSTKKHHGIELIFEIVIATIGSYVFETLRITGPSGMNESIIEDALCDMRFYLSDNFYVKYVEDAYYVVPMFLKKVVL